MKVVNKKINFLNNCKILFVVVFLIIFFFNLKFVRADNLSNLNIFDQKKISTIGDKIILKAGYLSEELNYSTMVNWFDFYPYLEVDDFYYSEVENTDHCNSDDIFCIFSYSVRESGHMKKKVVNSIDKSKINFYVTLLSEKFNQESENAQIKFNVDKNELEVVIPEKNGIFLNVEKSTDAIYQNISTNQKLPSLIDLVYDVKKADIRSDNLSELGIDEMIGEGYSTFIGSTPTRIHNIKTAIQQFDGWVIYPNEEASFVKQLGLVDGEHGYKEELVIKNNKTEKEFGGGICQVSTTTFRAAIYSGLKITSRRNHAYPVSYYNPQGMDAAVYTPTLDLKFVNNTDNYILVQVEMREESNELFFRFYGSKKGRDVEVKGPFITQRNPDGSLRTYFTQKVVDRGEMIINDTFKSFYNSPNNYPHS